MDRVLILRHQYTSSKSKRRNLRSKEAARLRNMTAQLISHEVPIIPNYKYRLNTLLTLFQARLSQIEARLSQLKAKMDIILAILSEPPWYVEVVEVVGALPWRRDWRCGICAFLAGCGVALFLGPLRSAILADIMMLAMPLLALAMS